MMDVQVDGREVRVRLQDDVWVMEEPGTICFTLTQAATLRRALNSLDSHHSLDAEPEDG